MSWEHTSGEWMSGFQLVNLYETSFPRNMVNKMKALVLYHSVSGNTKKMVEALAEGYGDGATLWDVDAKRFDIKDLKNYGAVAVGAPDYFSYVPGTLKTFMDDLILAERAGVTGTKEKKVALLLSHGGGGKAQEPLEALFGRLGEVIGETISCKGEPSAEVLAQCKSLGEKLASS